MSVVFFWEVAAAEHYVAVNCCVNGHAIQVIGGTSSESAATILA